MAQTPKTDNPNDSSDRPRRRDHVASAGLDPDTWDKLEDYKEERDISRSEAVRRLIRVGIEAEVESEKAFILRLHNGEEVTTFKLNYLSFFIALFTVGCSYLVVTSQYKMALGMAVIGILIITLEANRQNYFG